MKRLLAYYQVYKKFDYGYSPIRFWYNKYVIAYMNSAIQKQNDCCLKRILPGRSVDPEFDKSAHTGCRRGQ